MDKDLMDGCGRKLMGSEGVVWASVPAETWNVLGRKAVVCRAVR